MGRQEFAPRFGKGGAIEPLRTGIQQEEVDAQIAAAVAAALEDAPSGADPDDDINLIYNGKFESALVGTEGWYSSSSEDATISRKTVSPIDGTGSLLVTVTNDDGGIGVFANTVFFQTYDVGDTYRLSFDLRGSGDLMVYLDYGGAPDVDGQWTGTATGVTQSVTTDFVIPSGPPTLDMQIATAWDGGQVGVAFELDNVKLVKIASA